MDLDDDDSENDSDYVPGAEEEKDMEEDVGGERKLVSMSKAAQRRVNALWLEMQEEDRKSTEAVMMKSINYEANRKPLSEQKRLANEIILSSIFGKRVGKRLASFQATPEDVYSKEDIKKRALESVQNVAKRRKITETRKFAGKEISIQRTVLQTAADSANQESKSKSSSSKQGIDQVLSTIKGPKLVSTVAKSSMDWDVYKEKEGLEEDLQAAAKDGYLTRKDFLERCDVRTYEVEKVDRITTKAGGAPSAGSTL